MIGMFVSDQDGRDRIGVHTQGFQPLKRLLAAQTSIDKEASAPRGYQGAIPGARRG
jgi:hypothetical protein